MSDIAIPKPRGAPRGRPFTKGKSGNPQGREVGCRNKASLAAEALLDGEADMLTRRAIELAIDTFVRAIETSDFDRRLQMLEANAARA